MQKHERFEELCSLAAVGQLSPEEHRDLATHLLDCASCRTTLRDMATITDSWMPATAGLSHGLASIGLSASSKGNQASFVARARSQGINLTRQADGSPSGWSAWPFNLAKPYFAAVAAAACVIAVVFFVVRFDPGRWRSRTETQVLQARIDGLVSENAVLRQKAAGADDRVSEYQQAYAARFGELELLRQQRDAAQEGLAALQMNAADTHDKQISLEQQLTAARADLVRASQNYVASSRELAATRAELDATRASHIEDRTMLAAQQKKLEESTQRPAVENAVFEHERELLAANRDIRDLMGARNLHIVDVHDRDSKGKAQRSFGRVFFTEGKSLIFYAFDLSDAKIKNASFQAWGRKEDGTKDAISLGMFYMDDKSQSRWVLRYSDPAVLAAIDSVFVTVEPPGGGKKPTGEKRLYAFLNFDANHP